MPSLAGDLPGSIPLPLDAVIIGAGIAGAAAALRLARTLGPSAHIALIEHCRWPRPKVCGGCLNHAALALLHDLGITERHLHDAAAAPITHLHLRCGRRAARWPLPRARAINRASLDDVLVRAAVAAGVRFIPHCSAAVLAPPRPGDAHPVVLRRGDASLTCTARTILIADGLSGSSLDALPAFAPRVHRASWIGLGGTLEAAAPAPIAALAPAGEIAMHIAPHGYVGIVRLADHSTHLAAAIDPAFLRSQAERGGPLAAITAILRFCRADLPPRALDHLAIKGTPALTRRRPRVGAPGLLVLGDAAGYVEPFTGEGMTWALAAAAHAADLAALAAQSPDPRLTADLAQQWQHWHTRTLARRQLPSRALRLLTHHPAIMSPALAVIARSHAAAGLAAMLSRRIAAPDPGLTAESAA